VVAWLETGLNHVDVASGELARITRGRRARPLTIHAMTDVLSTRREQLARLVTREFDLLVIGGGITGCGIARDAALRGLSVALVEKNDFGSGTSSRSSRLVHGGVRYLEHGHLHLVFESSAERQRLLVLAPHLVRPLSFTWPVYAGSRVPRWKLGAGLLLYDALALFRNVGRHRRLSRADVLRREPMLQPDGLVGGALYFDAATDDARLALANALGAAAAGAVVVNHASVVSLIIENDRVAGAKVHGALDGADVEVRARVVVNATGPWSDELRRLDERTAAAIRGSKGVHIAVPRERVGNHGALTLLAPQDGRVFFVLPGERQTIVGTTDTYTASAPDQVRASNEDVHYLLDAANAFFPAAGLAANDVVSAWAGIRPLISTRGDVPGSVSREHAIVTSPRGLVSITGGKLTTYRVMAADVVKVVLARLQRRPGADRARSRPLPGGDFNEIETLIASAIAATDGAGMARHLVASYGSRWNRVWDEITRDGGEAVVADGLPYTIGELRYCARHEMAYTLGDLLIRRTHLAYETPDHGLSAAHRAVQAFGPDVPSIAAIRDYEFEIERMFGLDP
jgi:glycerol-3-phosphate dehydrogenase